MRGAPAATKGNVRQSRIIPADAGSTLCRTCCRDCRRDHPRGCGEHDRQSDRFRVELGSSPRMRGARHSRVLVSLDGGIIPADAGSTAAMAMKAMNAKDHPRGCGEHSYVSCPKRYGEGSSPRMRGARKRTYRWARKGRIIPADAGSTTCLTVMHDLSWDHPRGCGEHQQVIHLISVITGSSPRMRGALGIGLFVVGLCGIIPADAGSTFSSHWMIKGTEDHPRGCGEHYMLIKNIRSLMGSSPRMRGARLSADPGLGWRGIIPADAGSTRKSSTPTET